MQFPFISMVKGHYAFNTCILFGFLLMSLASGQTDNKGLFFQNLKEELKDEFAFDIVSLNKTWADFLQARSDLNETASKKSWLIETSPGNGLFMFSLAGLANFKSKVMQMVEQKNKYLAERAQLRQQMAEALFNRSIPFFQAVQGNFSGEIVNSQPFSVIQHIFGLVSDRLIPNDDDDVSVDGEDDADENDVGSSSDGNVEKAAWAADVSGDSIIDSVLTPYQAQSEDTDSSVTSTIASSQSEQGLDHQSTRMSGGKETTTTYPWARWKAWHKNIWWNPDAASKKQEFIKAKIQKNIEKRQKWERFASERFGGGKAWSKPWSGGPSKALRDEPVSSDNKEQENILEGIKEKLRTQFQASITSLNDSRSAFLEAKEDMALGASKKPWDKSSAGGLTTFDPDALMSFKAKIREMVALKNKYVAERAELKQNMLTALKDLLLQHLQQLTESSENVQAQPVNGPETTTSGTDLNSILEEMIETGSGDVDADITEGLPFARSLLLAAAPHGPSSGGDQVTTDGGGSGTFAVLIVLGVVAVVASVVLVGVVALRKAGHRSLYYRLG